jgi:hypothetical protein
MERMPRTEGMRSLTAEAAKNAEKKEFNHKEDKELRDRGQEYQNQAAALLHQQMSS